MFDSFQRNITYLRVSVTELCNLRCRYCMPPEGVCKKSHEEMLSEEQLLQALHAAASVGITKLRITGGEPLVKKNILSICEKAAKVPDIKEVALTTNGTLLPPLAGDLKNAGISRINLSLDSLNAEKYRQITRVGELSDALAGLDSALRTGFQKVKINTVLIGGFNEAEIPELAGLTRKDDVDVRFIELMPIGSFGGFGPEAFIPTLRVLEALPELVPEEKEGVARMYRLPGAKGRVGLISPVSRHFCGQCSRLRLTADGKLLPCLHAPLEYSLKGLSMPEMEQVFRTAILAKPEKHDILSCENPSNAARNMNCIGG